MNSTLTIVPRLPHETKNFQSMSAEERELWAKLFTIKEQKDEAPTMTSRGDVLAEAIKAYKEYRNSIKQLEEAKERAAKVIYAALVRNRVGKIETNEGSATLTPFTREESDKEYLRTVAPEGFTVVPDRLQVNVK